MRFANLGLLLTAFAASGCTFGSLGDYDVQSCAVAATQAEDACDALNQSDPSSCTPYQCDAATLHCRRAPRDDDRDGDPADTCGGTDCADQDTSRSGRFSAAPTSVLHTSAALFGQDLQLSAESGDSAVAAYVEHAAATSACIRNVPFKGDTADAPGKCDGTSLNETIPAQPFGRVIEGAAATAFVSRYGCPEGALSYLYDASGVPAQTGLACDAQPHGAARPALAFGDAADALVTAFDAPVSSRDDQVLGCADAQPAALTAWRLAGATTPKPAFKESLTLSKSSLSVRPAAMTSIPGTPFVAVAAPDQHAATLWVVRLPELVVVSTLALDGFVDARAVSITLFDDHSTLKLGLAAELGCDKQSLQVAFGTLDAETGAAKLGAPTEVVAAGSELATAASLSWVRGAGGYLLTWLGPGEARAQRFAPDGTTLLPQQSIETGVSAALALASGSVLLANGATSTFSSALLKCP